MLLKQETRETKRETKRLQDLAREYRQRGYKVIVNPAPEQLPPFLAQFQLDLVAFGQAENVVVEVRTQATLPDKNPSLDVVARALHRRPDWRYELVVTNPREPKLVPAKDANALDAQDIIDRLSEARQLSQQEHGEAAFLIVWSALEAILRRLALQNRITAERDNSAQLVKSLLINGVLERQHYELLQEGLWLRNLLAHGFKEQKSYAKTFEELLKLAEELGQASIYA